MSYQERQRSFLDRCKVPAALLAGFLMVANCQIDSAGASDRSQSNNITHAHVPKRVSHQEQRKAFHLSLKGLLKYRVNFQSHEASIAMGECVAWRSEEPGDITVTINPGLDFIKSGNNYVEGLVFSYYSSESSGENSTTSPPQVALMNGPYMDTLKRGKIGLTFGSLIDGSTKVFAKGYEGSQPSLLRHISDQPIQGEDGRWAYKDLATGEPVIKTAVTGGPFTHARILSICNQLEPGYYSSQPLGSGSGISA